MHKDRKHYGGCLGLGSGEKEDLLFTRHRACHKILERVMRIDGGSLHKNVTAFNTTAQLKLTIVMYILPQFFKKT